MQSTLHVIRPDGSGERILRDGADFVLPDYAAAETYGQPAWATDGKHILLPTAQLDSDGQGDAYMLLVDAATGAVRNLTARYGDYAWAGRMVTRRQGPCVHPVYHE
jgi:hypothetical protein